MQLRKPLILLTLLSLALLTLVGLEFSSVAQTNTTDSEMEDIEMDPPLQPHEIDEANKVQEQAELRAKRNPSYQPTAAELEAEKEAELRPQPSEEFLEAENQRVLDEGWLSSGRRPK